ncbi:putative zinc-type alcohol dehydrogenase-like protein YjmD [Deltaproteobacteria bacterium]|nr:putative zinc-type alcohol dehydrogenase-like protein YjmD [Deltaproteobacteria bacterium]
MKAMVFENKFEVSVKEVENPLRSPEQALIRILACGICGGDIHFYEGEHPYSNYPRIAGHELVGVIEELPKNFPGLKVGDRVVATILYNCGRCYPCRHGRPNCCADLHTMGIHVPGAYGEFLAVPAENLVKVPDNLTLEEAVLTEPYTIGNHVVGRSGIPEGEAALVLGVGPIGLAIVDILKAKGHKVIVSDPSPYRRRKALAIGADIAVNPAEDDLLAAVLCETDNEGMGYVFEAAGAPKVMESTFSLVAASGTIIIAGLTKYSLTFPGTDFTRKELSVIGSRNAVRKDFEAVLNLLERGVLHPGELLTKTIKIDDAAEEFRKLYADQSKDIKAAIYF